MGEIAVKSPFGRPIRQIMEPPLRWEERRFRERIVRNLV